jgi:hypothetical protein
VVKDLANEFIHWRPKSMLMKSSQTDHIPRRADRFPLITGNNPPRPIWVDVGAVEALHELLGVLEDEGGNRPWLHWRRLGGVLVAVAVTRMAEETTVQGKEGGSKLQRGRHKAHGVPS